MRHIYISNNIETNNRDRDINILKSTINNLIQENKQLLESNKQLKIEDSKLRDFIKVAASKLGTQIQLILGGLNCCRDIMNRFSNFLIP